MVEQTNIDHINYPKYLHNKSIAQLAYVIQDAREAIEAMPEGHKAGYYADEINYCAMEIRRRNQ